VREAAYGLLSEAERRAGHRAAGQYLERMGEPEPMVLAEHYLHGGELERAARFFARAAVELMEGSDLAGALRCVERGIGCGATGEVLGTLHAVAALAHLWGLNFPAAYEKAHQALPLLTPGCAAWYRAIGAVITLAGPLGQHESMLPHAHLLLETAPLAGAEAVLLEQSFLTMSMLATQGHLAVARALLGRMQEICARLGENEVRARGLMHVANAMYVLLIEGAPGRYYTESVAAASCFTEVGDWRYQVISEMHVGLALGLLGELAAGVGRLQAALSLCRKLGETMLEDALASHLALLLFEMGEPEPQKSAVVLAEHVVATSPVINFWTGISSCTLALARAARGEFAEAEALVRKPLSIVEALGPLATATLGRILAAQGKLQEARAAVDVGLERLAGRSGKGFMDVRLHLVAAELRHAMGEGAAARESLARATAIIEEHAAGMADEAMRARYRADVADNARAFELRRLW
jgi:tetratricopeptide (TPR) repeat protein